MKKLRELWHTDLIRPLIYKAFTRLMWGLFLALLLSYFAASASGRDLRGWMFLLFAVLCLGGAWLSHLQLDGMTLPKLDAFRDRLDRTKHKQQGDLIDYIDQKPETNDALDDDELHLCLLLADLICALIFLVLSLVIY